ncbi:MAG: hypothetical protein ACRDPR_07450 [Nocardioidaceae bacterium]
MFERHGVRYLLVGDGAAIAYGATRPTGDLDLIPARDRANLGRLAEAMKELGARLRVAGMSDEEARALPVQLSAEALGRIELSTWRSDAGDFDVLADMPSNGGRRVSYDDLVPRSMAVTSMASRSVSRRSTTSSRRRSGPTGPRTAPPCLSFGTSPPGATRKPDSQAGCRHRVNGVT